MYFFFLRRIEVLASHYSKIYQKSRLTLMKHYYRVDEHKISRVLNGVWRSIVSTPEESRMEGRYFTYFSFV